MAVKTMEPETYKDVVVIGNGPSGITLSYLLSGNWPFYNGQSHPIEFLQHRLEENKDKAIIEQDLQYLSEGLEGRSSNPVSVLFDTLMHPLADLGSDHPSVLSWQHNPSHIIDHVVLGKGHPGGAWQKMDGNTLTISLGSWMELPALSIHYWNKTTNRLRFGQSGLKQKRATVQSVAEYYRDYVELHHLRQYFSNNSVVTSVSKIDDEDNQCWKKRTLWKVSGHFSNSSLHRTKNFMYITPNVILATGNSDCCNKLNIEGEDLPFVLYSLGELEELIYRKELSSDSGKLLIVGAGLTAADAVIASRFHGISTLHVFRRSVFDTDLIFNKLPENVYPEYHKVHQMMQQHTQELYEGYKAFSQHQVHSIKPNGEVILISCDNEKLVSVIQVSHVLILIGMHPDLSFLPDSGKNLGLSPDLPIHCKTNPININLHTHECVNATGLYAVGPLVGDNFVRFVQGGCLAVASHIWKKHLI